MMRSILLAYYQWRLAQLKRREQHIAVQQMRIGFKIGQLGGDTGEIE